MSKKRRGRKYKDAVYTVTELARPRPSRNTVKKNKTYWDDHKHSQPADDPHRLSLHIARPSTSPVSPHRPSLRSLTLVTILHILQIMRIIKRPEIIIIRTAGVAEHGTTLGDNNTFLPYTHRTIRRHPEFQRYKEDRLEMSQILPLAGTNWRNLRQKRVR